MIHYWRFGGCNRAHNSPVTPEMQRGIKKTEFGVRKLMF